VSDLDNPMAGNKRQNPGLTPDTRIITTGVRPPRIVVFININDHQWMHTCLRVIECCTAQWGGWYSCLIPTDGCEIADPFWAVLEAFDPDYLFVYHKAGVDQLVASPEEFEHFLEQGLHQNPDFCRALMRLESVGFSFVSISWWRV
jgi:hypothetical protein